MGNHKHYYSWTIEWEEHEDGGWLFGIGRKVIEAYQGTETYQVSQIGVYSEIYTGISACQDLIDDIIVQQNNIAKKVLNIC